MSHADFLWGKTNDGDRRKDVEGKFLTVSGHLRDTGELAALLWDRWMSPAMKAGIAGDIPLQDARHWYILSSALHDIGKLTPLFYEGKSGRVASAMRQRMEDGGYSLSDLVPGTTRHEIAAGAIVGRMLRELGWSPEDIESYVLPMMSHHGFTPSKKDALLLHEVSAPSNKRFGQGGGATYQRLGWGLETWSSAQRSAWDEIVSEFGAPRPVRASAVSQSRLIAAITIADWAASRDDHLLTGAAERIPGRIERSWESLRLTGHWNPSHEESDLALFHSRFGDESVPRDTQVVAASAARQAPQGGSITIIESPPGEGKTRAALVSAEIQAAAQGRCGMTFALPTRMTTDSMWSTVEKWARTLDVPGGASVFLGHSNADLNADYQSLNGHDGDLRRVDLFSRQMGLFSSFSVETVDQLLPSAKRNAYTHLRNFALSDKVVIVDEVHSYSDFTSEFLYAMLRNLGAQGVPVILLSATLSPETRGRLLSSYARESEIPIPKRISYPSITSWDATHGVVSRDVVAEASEKHLSVTVVEDSPSRPIRLAEELRSILRDGGCVAVVRSTVSRAQSTYEELSKEFPGDVVLLHSRLTARDRSAREKVIVDALKEGGDRPRRMIVVATQVIEQSLDIDFDIIFSDPAPYDQIIQRSGRDHRHSGNRRPPALAHPRVVILKDLTAHHGVYPDYLIYASLSVLEGKAISGVSVPRDIASDIRRVYDPKIEALGERQRANYLAWRESSRARSDQAAERTADLTGGSVIAVNVRKDEFSDHSSDIRGEVMFEAVLCYSHPSGYQPVGSSRVFPWGARLDESDVQEIALSRVQLHRSAASVASERKVRERLNARRPKGWRGVLSFATPVFSDHDGDGMFDISGERFSYDSILGIEKEKSEA